MTIEHKNHRPILPETVIAEIAGIFKGFIRELDIEIQDAENWPPLKTSGQIRRRDQELAALRRSKVRIESLQAVVTEVLQSSNQQFKETP